MKGIVFSELMEMVEERFSPEIADKIIESSALPSGGSYTSVGTYDHNEILTLVAALSVETGIAGNELVKAFGAHLASRFTTLYPSFFIDLNSVFDFLETIDQHVHVEVRKLYPDAELPAFSTQRTSDKSMEMLYESRRPFADLAEGLIVGCASFFDEEISVSRKDDKAGDLYKTLFNLQLVG